ncbi:MAG: lytic transglycosylase domain-containing protein [Patescibacteria group bacterium]|nr:lytic transglycosylase domain-containing protein [Patescibacteria group bacterium]
MIFKNIFARRASGSATLEYVLLLLAIIVFILLLVLLAGVAKRSLVDKPPGQDEGGGTGTANKDCIERIDPKAKDYVEIVNAAAAKYGQDPALMLAQLKQENGFNATGVSHAGAQGIAQFMPATWSEYGQDGNNNGTKDPNEPEDAIYAQAAYLKAIKNTLGPLGTTENVLAGYNAGPGAVQQYGGIPPYDETQKYVKNIMATYKEYKKCLETTNCGDVQIVPGKKIYLHWSAGDYNTPYPDYNYNILGDGSVVMKPGGDSTAGRNTDAIGIAVAAGAGNVTSSNYPSDDIYGSKTFHNYPIKPTQIEKMAEIIAALAKTNNIPIDSKHVMTHAEAGSLRDFPADLVRKVSPPLNPCPERNPDDASAQALGMPTCNYGPSSWKDGWPGGSMVRWDFWEKGDQIRALAQQKLDRCNQAAAQLPTGDRAELINKIKNHPHIKFSGVSEAELNSLSDGLLRFLLAIGDSGNGDIFITCLTNHSQLTASGNNSQHPIGEAVDLGVNNNLQKYIFDNRSVLNIHQLLGPIDRYYVDDGKGYTSNHDGLWDLHQNHIHVGVNK